MPQRIAFKALSWILLFAACVPAVAGEPAPSWKSTATLSAPEAVQAAAADEKFVYAISSTQVAKYDRQSGERVAVSSGEAKHLNSGFFWNGRLYLAHSNYPKTPERSDLKVLDTETMRLSTFKDFADYGGSLTWAIRHEGHWWLNFARYGADNAQTFLVKFNDDWKELGRWTYPPEVISQLGRHSLSGGIWRDGSLLVTGHDDPVLFKLRLPVSGDVLEFVEKQSAPFSGQGIASDPVTGGLLGIHRAKRQVVFAAATQSEPIRLRVLTYNIHHGEGIDRKLDLERIARVIRSVEPDIVALQEVDRTVERSGSVDQHQRLAELTKMEAVFGANIPLQGGEYGNAVLSRWPIARHANHKLPLFDESEQRGLLEVEIKVPGGSLPLIVLATHFDHRSNDRQRLASVKQIEVLIGKLGDRPALLAGDLNDTPESPTLMATGQQWTRSNVQPMPTIPVAKPNRQIDFVLFRPASHWKVVETKVLDEAVASDHRAFLAVLELSVAP